VLRFVLTTGSGGASVKTHKGLQALNEVFTDLANECPACVCVIAGWGVRLLLGAAAHSGSWSSQLLPPVPSASTLIPALLRSLCLFCRKPLSAINYMQHPLTRVLETGLGGNAITACLLFISPGGVRSFAAPCCRFPLPPAAPVRFQRAVEPLCAACLRACPADPDPDRG
jgi:hypothetical protein